MAPKFGATKFRNAVPAVPPRDAWYRTGLSSNAPTNTAAYSSVVKANTEHVVTLTPGGDVSVRGYAAVGEHEGDVWTGKLGAVADWDLSRLEDRGMYVAGGDGSVTYYTVNGDGLAQRATISSKVSAVAAHPTTAGLALGASNVVSIYDVSAPEPALTLSSPNDIPLWSAAWSADGRLVAGVTKKGAAHIWDPRAGSAPQLSRDLSSQMQALKPVRVAFAGGDMFVTSFSRSRTRQYSLYTAAAGLATSFTAALDTSQGPLEPLVDEERRIVFLAGKGDMTLRQVELSGSEGYQEVVHPLPSPLTSSSVAVAHWSTLPVMEAQIATVLLPTQDKDGDTILPLHVKVPRRQLIDYHGDLYPDPLGTVPEQSASDWLAGGDNMPLRTSVDPARRGEWEKSIASGKAQSAPKLASGGDAETKPAPAAPKSEASAPPPPPTIPAVSAPTTETTPLASPKPVVAATSGLTPPASDLPAHPSTPPPNRDVPPLEGDETYSSTAYKIRNIGPHILAYQKAHVSSGAKGPLMVGFQGPQGCGKTTLCDALLDWLKEQGLRPAVLSLDDLYLPHEGLKKVADEHPNNSLLSGRGPPGTHDIDLAIKTLQAVKDINNGGRVELPIFDKSLCGGEGDRSSETVSIEGPIDVFVIEGWSFGFQPLSSEKLKARYAAKNGKYFPEHSLESLEELNTYLGEFGEKVYPFFSAFIAVEPTSYEYVFKWRLQQEHSMKEKNGGKGLSDDQVRKFVERYMPAYELWVPDAAVSASAPWAGRLVRVKFGAEREVLAIEMPEAAPKTEQKMADAPKNAAAAGAPAPAASATAPATTPAPSSSAPAAAAKSEAPASSPTPSSSDQTSTAAAIPPPAATPNQAQPAAPSARFNPDWSRKYIAGKSPLIPSYDHIPPVVTLHQDSIVLRATPDIAVFPIDGPGGRVCVHPLSKRGRLPVGGIGYLSGGVGLADFAVDLYSDHVVLAGEDSVLRVWNVGKEGVEGPGPEPAQVLRGNKIDKIVQIVFHPTAKDLLVVATNEFGNGSLRFFDLSASEEVKQVELGIKAITGFALSPHGDRVAVATKDCRVAVLDPRNLSTMVIGKAHASPRSFQLEWVDESHIVSLGFGRGSVRQLNLYKIGDSEITTIATQSLGVSPSVLFPVYDSDTNILQVWGKGERTISAYEIKDDTISKLSDFTGSSPQLSVVFLPKTTVDVKKVEVAHALRLTANTIEDVAFTIPRNRPEFFQDDIYVPTIEPRAVSTAAAWLQGEDTPPSRVALCPAGMTPLSAAPPATKVQRPKFVPAANVMTAEERKKQEMDEMFQRAKIVDSDDSDGDDGPKRGGIPPPDDDW